MKKRFLPAIFLGLLATNVYAQENKAAVMQQTPPPKPPAAYLSDTQLPSFKILETDSVTYFNTGDISKGKKSILIFFDPGCSHCINFLEKLFPAMDSFKKVNFYMTSVVHDMSDIRKFMDTYHVSDYKNIKVVGKDVDFFFIGHYGLQRFPGAVVYDEKKKFLKFLESDEVTVAALYELTH